MCPPSKYTFDVVDHSLEAAIQFDVVEEVDDDIEENDVESCEECDEMDGGANGRKTWWIVYPTERGDSLLELYHDMLITFNSDNFRINLVHGYDDDDDIEDDGFSDPPPYCILFRTNEPVRLRDIHHCLHDKWVGLDYD